MKISQLVVLLSEYQQKYGDCTVDTYQSARRESYPTIGIIHDSYYENSEMKHTIRLLSSDFFIEVDDMNTNKV